MQLTPAKLAEHFIQLEHTGKLGDFLKEALKNEAFKAHVSYYQKWLEMSLEKENITLIDDVISSQRQEVLNAMDKLPLGLEYKFGHEELEIIFLNLRALQLTYGCTGQCSRCGFDAVPKVREQIPFKQLQALFEKYGSTIKSGLEAGKGSLMPYWASDPTDYNRINDVLELIGRYIGFENISYITRRIPSTDTAKILTSSKRPIAVTDPEQRRPFAEGEKRHKKVRELGLDKVELRSGKNYHIIGTSYDPKYKEIRGRATIEDIGIGYSRGILITPRGIYSMLHLGFGSPKYPQGEMIVPFEGLKVPKGHNEIKEGHSLEKYLSHGIVLIRIEEEPIYETKFNQNKICYILYCNQIYKVNYDNGGMIIFAEMKDQNDLVQGPNEDTSEYKYRLISYFRATIDKTRRELIKKKLDKLNEQK